MKAATVATGNQTYSAEVSGAAMSVSSRERKGRGVGVGAVKGEGGVDGPLSELLLLECGSFYVVRKHTAVRHNKWSDGAIRGALLMVRGAQRNGTLCLPPLIPPTSICL